MISCDVCGNMVNAVMISGSHHYCEMCWYYEKSPILLLTKLWDSLNPRADLLFSPKLGRYVYPTKGQMDKCGFKLYSRKTFFNRKANERYKEIFVYKYYGNVKCLALEEYKSWPSHMKRCCKIGCTLY